MTDRLAELGLDLRDFRLEDIPTIVDIGAGVEAVILPLGEGTRLPAGAH